ncbi:MAG: hypothetical protein SGILL_004185 [Bacillariaceae sp.]
MSTTSKTMKASWRLLCLLLLWICSSNSIEGVEAVGFRGAAVAKSLRLQQPQESGGSGTGAAIPEQHRRVMEDKEEEVEDDEEEDEEEEDDNIMSPPPTASPTSVVTTAAPTLPPTFSATTATNQDDTDTTSTTTTPPIVDSNNDEEETEEEEPTATVSHSLLPVTVEVQGWHLLDSTKELVFRFHLEQYLLQQMRDNNGEVSSILQDVQLDRPWTVTTPAERRRRRRLRKLQEDSSTSTTSTSTTTSSDPSSTTNLLLQYQGRAVLKEAAGFWDSEPTEDLIHREQSKALLQNSAALQDYFIDLYLKQDDKTTDAIIFLDLEAGGSSVTWNPAATWDRIAVMNATQQQAQQSQEEEEDSPSPGNNDGTSQSQIGNDDGISTKTLVLVVCAVVLALLACLAVVCVLRFKKRGQSSRLSKLPGAPDVHAMELASDVDSEMDDEALVYDKSLLRSEKNNSPTMTRTSSWDEDDDNSSGKGNSGRISLARVTSLFSRKSKSSPSDEMEMEVVDDIVGLPPVSRSGSNVTSTSHSSKQNDEQGIEIFPHTSGDGNPVIDLTTPGRNASGIQFSQKEAPKPASRAIMQSPRQKKATQEEHDELDSVVANMNLYSMTSFDDESMMGYSLASADTGYKRNACGNENLQQLNVSLESELTMFADDGNSPQERSLEVPAPVVLSRQTSDDEFSNGSEPSNKNSMLPGVQNLLNSSKGPKTSSKSKKWYRAGKKNRPAGFVSSDSESVGTLEDVLEEASAKSDSSASSVFIEDDTESVEVGIADAGHIGVVEDETTSSYKEDNSEEGDASVASGADALSAVDGAGGLPVLGIYNESGKDTSYLNMLPQITPVPSEEMDEMVLQTPVVNNAGFGSMRTAAIRDDVSDAPSDERGNNVASLPMHSLMGPRERIQSVTSIDNDPAVVGYLMKERNSMKQRMRRKRADRKQSPVTMEV